MNNDLTQEEFSDEINLPAEFWVQSSISKKFDESFCSLILNRNDRLFREKSTRGAEQEKENDSESTSKQDLHQRTFQHKKQQEKKCPLLSLLCANWLSSEEEILMSPTALSEKAQGTMLKPSTIQEIDDSSDTWFYRARSDTIAMPSTESMPTYEYSSSEISSFSIIETKCRLRELLSRHKQCQAINATPEQLRQFILQLHWFTLTHSNLVVDSEMLLDLVWSPAAIRVILSSDSLRIVGFPWVHLGITSKQVSTFELVLNRNTTSFFLLILYGFWNIDDFSWPLQSKFTGDLELYYKERRDLYLERANEALEYVFSTRALLLSFLNNRDSANEIFSFIWNVENLLHFQAIMTFSPDSLFE